MLSVVVEILAKEWVKLFRLKPYLTSVLTAFLATVLAASITYLDKVDRDKREAKRLESQSYQQQLEQLNQTEITIRQLLEFVDVQKKTLQETEDTISELKSEKQKLQPLVESDRAVVEAIFRAQEDRVSANVWRERWIGFGFGVLASLVASFVWFTIGLLIKGRKHNNQIQPTADASAD
jgi:vacuolar-type H+-ATPase subunit I/STV1